jgi:hypothetical protein
VKISAKAAQAQIRQSGLTQNGMLADQPGLMLIRNVSLKLPERCEGDWPE